MAAFAQNTPGYNNKIPESILTPDHVETPIGDLNFFDGMPDEATVQKVYDNLIFMRGVEAFLSGIPATSIEAIRLGCVEMGAKRASDVVIFDKLMDSDPLFLTGNTDTVYASVNPRIGSGWADGRCDSAQVWSGNGGRRVATLRRRYGSPPAPTRARVPST